MDGDKVEDPKLFGTSRFAIVRGKDLRDEDAQQLCISIVEQGGQASIDTYDQNRLDITQYTHIVSSTIDFPDYDAARDAMIPVVKPTWVHQSIARKKLANPRQYNPDPKAFMSDVVVCFADLPEGDCDAIIGAVTAAGGLHAKRVASMVTHLVALTMTAEQCQLVVSKKLNIKIVLPHWFDDCLKLGARIDERPYLLPDPEILRVPQLHAPLAARSRQIVGASTPDPAEPRALNLAASPARRYLTVFVKRQVMLGDDLSIADHLRETLEEIVTKNGGTITKNVAKADMLVCRFRESREFKIASRAGKEVGNLAWLYYLVTHNTWTSPMRRLLHYPISKDGIPGFKNLRISLSNYSGDARIYLENLITAAGAECTKTLKQDNTHLVTAHDKSEKCQAAQEWGIHLINHLWLEESYAQWKMMGVTLSRYTHFPARTNLGEVVGRTSVDKQAVQRHFFPAGEDLHMADVDVEQDAMDDAPLTNDAIPPSSMLRSPGKETDVNGVIGKRQKMGDAARSIKPQTPAASRFASVGKENITPSTNSSRKSKEAAAAKLHEIAPDIALYEKEKKRIGGVVYGGRKKDPEKPLHVRKRSIDDGATSDDSDAQVAKRSKKAKEAPVMTLLISGYKKWLNQPKAEADDKMKLRDMGVVVTQDPARASHLAAPGLVRTPKVVIALAYAPVVVSTDFIDACLKHDELQQPEDYLLKDKAGEKKYGVSLLQSRERASQNKNKLLEGRVIFCVKEVNGGWEIFRSIVHANGGQCNLYEGRPYNMVGSRRCDTEADEVEDETQKEAILISSQGEGSVKLWRKFQQMAEGSRKIPRIVKSDWLLDTAIAQRMLPFSKYEIRVPI